MSVPSLRRYLEIKAHHLLRDATGPASASSAPTTGTALPRRTRRTTSCSTGSGPPPRSTATPRHQVLPRPGLRPPLRADHRDLPEHGRPLPRPGRLRTARRGHRARRPSTGWTWTCRRRPRRPRLGPRALHRRPAPGRRATATPGSAPSTTGGACCTWATCTASGEMSPAVSCPGWPRSAPAASSTSARSARSTPPSPPTPAWPPATPASWTTAGPLEERLRRPRRRPAGHPRTAST